MKIDLIIISGILVIISFLPFILFPILRSREERRLKNMFKEEVSSRGLNISYQLAWNNNFAGIDILKREMVLIQWLDGKLVVHHIFLNKFHTINILLENRQVEKDKRKTEELSLLQLVFYSRNAEEPVMVDLYDYDLTFTQDCEFRNAQKLLAELQKYAGGQPVLVHTA